MLTVNRLIVGVLILFLGLLSSAAIAEDYTIDTDKILVTIVLKHQQDKNLTELQEKMDKAKFWESFPPEGMEVESWYIAMGLGQVITLKLHPKDLRRLNLAVEKSVWGAFETDFYPTYEFKEIAKSIKAKKLSGRD